MILTKNISISLPLLIILIFLSPFLFPQTIFDKPLSQRIANYNMDVSLNPKTKIIYGFETLHWKNTSNDNITELQFHLYLNAFKNTNSTFMKESGGQHRGFSQDESKQEK